MEGNFSMSLTRAEKMLGLDAARGAVDLELALIHLRANLMESLLVWLARATTSDTRHSLWSQDKEEARDTRLRLEMNMAAIETEEWLRAQQPLLRNTGLIDFRSLIEAIAAIIAVLGVGSKRNYERVSTMRNLLLRQVRDEGQRIRPLLDRLAELREELARKRAAMAAFPVQRGDSASWLQAAVRRGHYREQRRRELFELLERAAGGPRSPDYREIMRLRHLVRFNDKEEKEGRIHVYWGSDDAEHGHAIINTATCTLKMVRPEGVRTSVKYGGHAFA